MSRVNPVINISRLYRADPEIPAVTETPIIEEENGFEVPSEILDAKEDKKGNFKYKVIFGNETDVSPTWIAYDKIKDYEDLISDFHRLHPAKPKPTRLRVRRPAPS